MPLSGPRASINLSSSGDNTVIAGVAAEVITIYNFVVWCASAVTVVFKDGATAINGANGFNFPAQTGFFYNDSMQPLVLGSGNAFVINLGGNVNVNGWVYYTVGGTA